MTTEPEQQSDGTWRLHCYDGLDAVGWTEIWPSEPPPIGVQYQVVKETWNHDYTVRTIHEWHPCDG